jgi:hypothetical protein
MPDNELFIYLKMVTEEATRSSRAYHQGEQQRIRETAQTKTQAEKEETREIEANIKQRERSSKEAAQREKQDAADAHKWRMMQWNERQKKAKETFAAEAKDNKESLARQRQDEANAHKLRMMEWNEGLKTTREFTKLKEQLSKGAHDSELRQIAEEQKANIKLANDATAYHEQAWKKMVADSRKSAAEEMTIYKSREQMIEENNAAVEDSLKEIESERTKSQAIEAAADKKRAREKIRLENEIIDAYFKGQEKKAALKKAFDQQEIEADKHRFRELEKEQEQALQTGVRYFGKLTEASKETEGGILSIAKAYTFLRVASEISQGMHAAMQAVGDAVKDANAEIKTMVDRLEAIQELVQELASLRETKNDAKFASQVSREAASVGSTTEMHVAAHETFFQYGAGHIGEKNATPEQQKKDAALGITSNKDANELELFAENSSNAQGVKSAYGVRLMATVMNQRKPGETNDDLKLKWRKLFEKMKKAAGPTGQAIAQASEEIAESVGEDGTFKEAEEVMDFMAVMMEANAAKGYVYTEAVKKGNRIIRANKKGEMKELGVTKDMNFEQMTRQVIKRSREIAKKEGKSVEDVLGRYYDDARAGRGMMAAVEQGENRHRFETAKDAGKNITLPGAIKENADYLTFGVGKKRAQGAQRDAIAAARSEEEQARLEMERDYTNSLENQGKLREPRTVAEQSAAAARTVVTGKTEKEYQVSVAMGADIEAELMKTEEGQKWLRDNKIGGEFGYRSLGGIGATDNKTMAEALQMSKVIKSNGGTPAKATTSKQIIQANLKRLTPPAMEKAGRAVFVDPKANPQALAKAGKPVAQDKQIKGDDLWNSAMNLAFLQDLEKKPHATQEEMNKAKSEFDKSLKSSGKVHGDINSILGSQEEKAKIGATPRGVKPGTWLHPTSTVESDPDLGDRRAAHLASDPKIAEQTLAEMKKQTAILEKKLGVQNADQVPTPLPAAPREMRR